MHSGKRLEQAVGVIRLGANGPIFACDGGGQWELDPSRLVMKHLGQRVEVIGIRSGFNDLVCKQIRREGQFPEFAPAQPLETLLISAAVAYGLFITIASFLS